MKQKEDKISTSREKTRRWLKALGFTIDDTTWGQRVLRQVFRTGEFSPPGQGERADNPQG